jgi:hypothetical protein
MTNPAWVDALRSSLTPWIVEAVVSGLIVLVTLGTLIAIDRSEYGVVAASFLTLLSLTATVAGFLASSSLERTLADVPEQASRLRVVRRLDVVASAGLWLLVVASWLVVASGGDESVTLFATGWTGFLLLTVATPRLHLAYRLRASIASSLGLGVHRAQLVVLGVVKSIYEAVWLGVCILLPGLFAFAVWLINERQLGDAIWPGLDRIESVGGEAAITLLFGALFGIPLYGVIWIAMIVTHSIFAIRVRRALDVLTANSGQPVDERTRRFVESESLG